ncbi:MAG TPA: 2,3-bisphosphoglycerate-independent phosphoglycerate mutase, partial [Actinobacteria bacterium]|nr:2,3-bisphosphoglycerate-independent phosphoglycerate mutase [Actinomycetota bacterium]
VASKDTVFRCNLITVKNGIIKDYSASHIETEDAATLIKAVDAELGSKEISFYPGMSYRHLTVFNNRQLAELGTVAPHDVMGQPIESLWPKGDGADFIIDLTKRSTAVLENHPINKERQAKGLNPANMIWLWGSGQKKALPSFKERFGLTGAVISAVDLIKGLGVSAGLEVVNVPGATGYYDTDYEAKAKASLKVLTKDDFVYVHVEAPDEAGHVGNVEEKVKALENFDKRLLRIMLSELDLDNTRIMLLPDHATPITLKTHTRDKVPYMIYPGNSGAQSFDENTAAEVDSKDLKGYELMVYFLQR